MKKSQLILGSLVSVMMVTASAAAKIPTFKDVDADGDGSVTEAEFAVAAEAGVKQKYGKLDKDGDGKLSKKEYGVVLEDEECE